MESDLDYCKRILMEIAARRKKRFLTENEFRYIQAVQGRLIKMGHKPRDLGLSLRQLGINPRAKPMRRTCKP